MKTEIPITTTTLRVVMQKHGPFQSTAITPVEAPCCSVVLQIRYITEQRVCAAIVKVMVICRCSFMLMLISNHNLTRKTQFLIYCIYTTYCLFGFFPHFTITNNKDLSPDRQMVIKIIMPQILMIALEKL